jgi:hypothetical protein
MGYVARVGQIRNADKMLIETRKEERPLEGHRCRGTIITQRIFKK